ncbi:DNA polymerase III subunit delta [Microlunatus speluncae]|uniref:DNA polymerase III subunit delta n=1 Tax=Microlunatus speluncae TaxID=2594267 RepID=UPI001FEB92D1|nr:DNA polymerase III subunit delta [Microlunatus speluncae]
MPSSTTSRAGSGGLARTVLVTGPEGLLADRAVTDVLTKARNAAPEIEVTEVEAGRLDGGRLAEISGASLFSSTRAAVIRNLADLPADLNDQVLELAGVEVEDLVLVLVHGGGMKGKGLLDKLRKLKPVTVVDCPQLKAWELPKFVSAEVKQAGGTLEPEAGQFLIDAVGHDLRALAAAIRQLIADTEGRIGVDTIRRYFGGRAEVTSFAVADAVLAGRTGEAMEQLRWATSTGVAPVLVTSALASGLRGLGKLISAPGGLREGDLAREVGVPPWKLKSMRAQVRGWDAGGLATALRAVASADAAVKGAEGDAEYALERAVLAVSEARSRR